MCSRTFSGNEKNFYLYVHQTPADLSDSDIRQIFSIYGEIKKVELHRVFIRDEAVDGHCFIEFTESENAVKALELEKKFKTELILGKYSLKFRHWVKQNSDKRINWKKKQNKNA